MCVNPLEREMMSDYTYVVVAASGGCYIRVGGCCSCCCVKKAWRVVEKTKVSAVNIFNIICDLPRKHTIQIN